MICCRYGTIGNVEPNLLSLSDFLNFKNIVLSRRKSVTKAKNASCQESARPSPLFVSNSWVLDVRDGNDDDESELPGSLI